VEERYEERQWRRNARANDHHHGGLEPHQLHRMRLSGSWNRIPAGGYVSVMSNQQWFSDHTSHPVLLVLCLLLSICLPQGTSTVVVYHHNG